MGRLSLLAKSYWIKAPLFAWGFLSLISLFGAGVGCTKKDTAGNSGAPKVVNLAIWSNYVTPETLKEFETKTGIRVQVAHYSSNEELLAKMQAGASGYDVALPSDYMVQVMVKLGLLEKLERSRISQFKELDAQFLNKPFDPGNQFSLPYDWGLTGIAVNRKAYTKPVKGWKEVFSAPELAGRFTLLDDVRETLGAALKAQGLSLNSRKPEEIQKAKELLLKQRPRLKGFTSEPLVPLAMGESWVAHAYLSDALQAQKRTQGTVEFIVPEEGATFWLDNLVIPKGAPHLSEAHQLIEFLLEAKTMAQTVRQLFVAPTHRGVFGLLSADLQKNPFLFPKESWSAKSEMIQDLGEAVSLWDRSWTEIKAAE